MRQSVCSEPCGRRRLYGAARAVVVLVCVGVLPAVGQEASSADDVLVFGMSTALTGPTSHLGINMRTGVLAAFEEANRAGGIHGRRLRLVALDDGYEPDRTVVNMHKLIDEEQVLAIVGNVGTPTAVAAIPIANAMKTPFFGAYTGAGVLRKKPPDRYVINFRASYAEETAAMVDALVDVAKIAPTEIAFFTQRDAFGDAGYVGGLAALKRHGLEDEGAIAHGRYERNTLAVENGLADILYHTPTPKAVIMVGTYAPSAEFIRLAKEVGLDALFLNVSFVGVEALLGLLGKTGDGTIGTQVVPHYRAELQIVQEHRAALKALDTSPPPTSGSLEGYIVGRILCRALAAIDGRPTRESIVDALESLGEFDLGLGVPLHLGPDNHQACHRVWPTAFRDGELVPFDWTELAVDVGGD